jgi:predicted dehydrogenase
MAKEIRVGFYGTGGIARHTHIPILQDLPGVKITAICDASEETLQEIGDTHAIAPEHRYRDGIEMLEKEDLDVLFSCVPAFARTNVEVAAVEKGLHLFSEKPQAIDLETALRIDQAVRDAGVISTVGFRERHRPMFHRIREFLADKEIVHAQTTLSRPRGTTKGWLKNEDQSGGFLLEWGCHALDYTRYMTSRNVTHAQAFMFRPEGREESLSFSVNFRFDNGGTKNINSATFHPEGEFSEGRRSVPMFSIYYLGGRIDIYREGGKKWSYELNGEPVETEAFDPWTEHDRVFIEAIQSGDTSQLRNDYTDGLGTIGPLLAAIESNKSGGHAIEMEAFMKGAS